MTAILRRAGVSLAVAVALAMGAATSAAADTDERVIREPVHGQIVALVATTVLPELPPNPCRGLVIVGVAQGLELPPNPCLRG